jgi:outer membrane protein TolC
MNNYYKKMIRKTFLFLILHFLIGFEFSFSQTGNTKAPIVLSLKAAIEMGKTNGPRGKSINKNAQSNYWTYKSAATASLPQLSLTGDIPGLTRGINQVPQNDGTLKFLPQSQAFSNLNLSLNQNIMSTGGSVYFASGLSRITLIGNGRPSYWQSTPVQIGISQPLFRLNEMKWNLRQAKILNDENMRRQAEAMEDMSIEISQRYFDLYLTLNLINVYSFNIAVNDTIYQISKGRYELGKIAENDLLQSEYQLLTAKNNYQVSMNKKISQEYYLKSMLGIPLETPILLVAPEEIPLAEVSVDKAIAEARENRSVYLDFQYRENDALIDVKRSDLNRRPNGVLSLNYGLNQTSSDLSQVYKDPLGRQIASVRFNVPIVSWGRNKAEYMKSKANAEAVKSNIDYEKSIFEQDVITSVNNFRQLQASLLISAKADTIARKRYEVSKNRYLIGKIEMINLMIAQNEKDNARQNYYGTLQQLWLAYYQLRRNTLYDFMRQEKIIYDFLSN